MNDSEDGEGADGQGNGKKVYGEDHCMARWGGERGK